MFLWQRGGAGAGGEAPPVPHAGNLQGEIQSCLPSITTPLLLTDHTPQSTITTDKPQTTVHPYY